MSFNESWFAGNATVGLQRISMQTLRSQQLINHQLTLIGLAVCLCV